MTRSRTMTLDGGPNSHAAMIDLQSSQCGLIVHSSLRTSGLQSKTLIESISVGMAVVEGKSSKPAIQVNLPSCIPN